jgi:hypothetical protein
MCNIQINQLNSLMEERSINNMKVIWYCSQGLIANPIQVYRVPFLFLTETTPVLYSVL